MQRLVLRGVTTLPQRRGPSFPSSQSRRRWACAGAGVFALTGAWEARCRGNGELNDDKENCEAETKAHGGLKPVGRRDDSDVVNDSGSCADEALAASYASGGGGGGSGGGGGMPGQYKADPRKKWYTYVIIGASTTANAAIESILLLQPDADILLLTDGDVPSTSHADAPSYGGGSGDDGGSGLDDTDPDPAASAASRRRRRRQALSEDMPGDLLQSYNEWRRHITCGHGEDDARAGSPVTVLRADKKHLRIDAETRRVFLDDTHAVGYSKCLIATAGKPRKFYVLDSDRSRELLADAVNTLGSVEDFEQLATLAREGVGGAGGEGRPVRHVTVIGGGFLGSEVALALARLGRDRGMEVAQVYAEKAPMQRLLPSYLALQLQRRLEAAGVAPIAERLVTDFRLDPVGDGRGGVELVLQGWDKRSVETDHIVLASTHIEPDTQVARASGLEIDQNNGGIVVNGQFEAVAGVYAAGGVASYYDPALGRRRIDRYDHSVNSGLMAGHNMAASVLQQSYGGSPAELNNGNHNGGSTINGNGDGVLKEPRGPHPRLYTHQPMFRSHLADVDVVIEGVGEIDARLRTVGMWVSGSKGFGGSASVAGALLPPPPGTTPATLGGNGADVDGSGNSNSRGVPNANAYRRGVVYYLRGDRVAGILLWNTTDLLERARDVVRCQPKIASVKMLKRQIPLAPDDWLRVEETNGSLHFGNEVLTPPF